MSEQLSLVLYGSSAVLGTLVYMVLAYLTFLDLVATIRYPLEYVDRQRPLLIAAWRNFLFAVVLGGMFVGSDTVVALSVILPESETRLKLARLVLVGANWLEMGGGILLLIGRRLLQEQRKRAQQDGERDASDAEFTAGDAKGDDDEGLR